MIIIADFFAKDIQGGGELCTEEIINFFQKKESNLIKRYYSHEINENSFKGGVGTVLISNFMNLSNEGKKLLISQKGSTNYYIIEHDHKYCLSRNPLTYQGMVVPEHEILHKAFYKNAQAVFCQSKAHSEVLQKNLWIDNVVNLGCNLWSEDHLKQLEARIETKKTRSYGIMQSSNPIKGTREAIELCKLNKLTAELIPPLPQEQFWDEMAKTETIVFLPQTYETYCRFAIEAKILGCKLITNKAIGAMSEPYWNQNGRDLLETIKRHKVNTLNLIEETIRVGKLGIQEIQPFKPKVSLITTVYKGAEHMKGFLDAFVEQENRDKHELIIIDANSPENESEIVKPYILRCPNIRYEKINEKKTTMECFNMATDKAKGEYIAMCMIDDRLAPNHLDLLSKQLYLHPDIDLVYGDSIVETKPNQPWTKVRAIEDTNLFEHSRAHFSKEGMIKNLPGPVPMYRKSLHYKIGGYRNEILHAGDWEFYLRAVKNGSRFKKIDILVGLYYANPNGLSTTNNEKIVKERRKSEQLIFEEYKDVFGEQAYKQFKSYFDQWK